jgi:hypothetical protein
VPERHLRALRAAAALLTPTGRMDTEKNRENRNWRRSPVAR